MQGLGRALGAGAGYLLGGPSGMAVGGDIGGNAGNFLSKITGLGDYKITSNSLTQKLSGVVPHFVSTDEGLEVSHREFLGDVRGSISYRIFGEQFYPINPGLSRTFPWLSSVATSFEQYQMKGLVFEFKTTSGYVASTPSLGSVIMATQYDVLDPPFASKVEQCAYEFATTTVPCNNAIHPVECAPKVTQNETLKVRNTEPEQSLQLYDLGNFTLATSGMNANDQVVGELWVSYHVKFLKPKLDPTEASGYLKMREGPEAASVPGSSFLGSNPVLQYNSFAHQDMWWLFDGSGNINVYITRPGTYRVIANYYNTETTGVTGDFALIAGPGVTEVNAFFDSSVSVIYNHSVRQAEFDWIISCAGNSSGQAASSFVVGTTGIATPGAHAGKMDFEIIQIPSNFSATYIKAEKHVSETTRVSLTFAEVKKMLMHDDDPRPTPECIPHRVVRK